MSAAVILGVVAATVPYMYLGAKLQMQEQGATVAGICGSRYALRPIRRIGLLCTEVVVMDDRRWEG